MDAQMSGMVKKTHELCCPDLNLNLCSSSITRPWVLFLACLSLSVLTHKLEMIMATYEVVMRMKEENVSKVPGHY